MGMDVFGRRPTAEAGEYFRACVWAWRPIHELVANLCRDLVDPNVLAAMQWNEGAGPDDPEVCREMANRFRNWLSEFPGDAYFIEKDDVGETPEGMVMNLLSGVPRRVEASAYSVDRESLLQWSDFLACCGGFEVW